MNSQREMIDKVRGMTLTELLAFILSNPHVLTDPYFAEIAKAVRARHEALDGQIRKRFRR